MALETDQRRLDLDRIRTGTLALLTQPQHGFSTVPNTSSGTIPATQGQLMITFEWSDWRNGVFWWVQSVYVKPEWRRRGVYRAMHEYIAARAKKDSAVCGIRLYVEHQNHDAQTVYRRVGLSPSVYTVYEQDFILGPQRPNP